MNLKQKKRIIERFLTEQSINHNTVTIEEDDLSDYAEFDNLLEYIEANQNDLFDLATFEADDTQWKEFSRVLNYSIKLRKGSPPILESVDTNKTNYAFSYIKNEREILALPQDNYYRREVTASGEEDDELDALIKQSKIKLYALAQTFPGETAFDPDNSSKIDTRIKKLQSQIKKLPDSNPNKESLKARLDILTDLKKVNELKPLSIPQEDGSNAIYCTLAEAAGGVTEKVSLVRLDSAKNQLRNLVDRENAPSVKEYMNERTNYKLSTQAIIKLPKHGDIKEVQRESMALNISRMMRQDNSTSASTSVSYNGEPALFVPFSNIRLLQDYTSGETFTAGLGITGQTYTHYSTIKPIGEGVQGDAYVEDFGNALGLMYVCSDTDAIGGYNQNKALTNDRSLFIFDQVLMDSDKFILDSRLSLQPSETIMKHTRHGLGRNRTVIEDSSMDAKFASIMQVKSMSNKFQQYANHVSLAHYHRMLELNRRLENKSLSSQAKKSIITELKNVTALREDAITLREKIRLRIEKIDQVLPKKIGNISPTEIKQALILEKLLHNPRLFTHDARPYKNPWTNRQNNNVKQIRELDDNKVRITFSNSVPVEMLNFIKRQTGDTTTNLASAKEIIISKAHLAALREDILYPEHRLTINHDADYLALNNLAQIKNAYKEGNTARIIGAIQQYRAKMNDEELSTPEKLDLITKTKTALRNLIGTAKDKGFGMHVLKKFYFDAQKKLQLNMNPLEKPNNMDQAFAAALKLDRVSDFNKVAAEAIKQNKVNDPQFTGFLDSCVLRAQTANNHTSAQRESEALFNEAKETIRQLKTIQVVPIINHFVHKENDGVNIDINDINDDPFELINNRLMREREVLENPMPRKQVIMKEEPTSATEDVKLHNEGITVSNN